MDCSKGPARISAFGNGDVWEFISLFSTGGWRIVKWPRGVPLCMSQSVLSPALWWNLCVRAVWNNAACYLHSGIFIGAITQSSRVPVCIYVYRGADNVKMWKVTHNCLYINLHHIMKIGTWLHAISLLIKRQQQKKLPAGKKKRKSQANFKVLRINPAEASKVKSALIKFHVQRLSRFWCKCKDLRRRQRKPPKRPCPRR